MRVFWIHLLWIRLHLFLRGLFSFEAYFDPDLEFPCEETDVQKSKVLAAWFLLFFPFLFSWYVVLLCFQTANLWRSSMSKFQGLVLFITVLVSEAQRSWVILSPLRLEGIFVILFEIPIRKRIWDFRYFVNDSEFYKFYFIWDGERERWTEKNKLIFTGLFPKSPQWVRMVQDEA